MLRKGPLLAAAAAVLALVAAPAPAHGETGADMTHLDVRPVQLEPGENDTSHIETGEGPWRAGMVFVLNVCFFNDQRDARVELLFAEDVVVDAWNFTEGYCHKGSTLIPFDDGPYHLRVTNRAANTTQLFFFFDQTCDCTAKSIPLPHGFVLFGYDLKAGTTYRIGFPLTPEVALKGTVAVLEGGEAEWPDDFRTIVQAAAEGPGWLNLTVTPEADVTHYVFLEDQRGGQFDPNRQPVQLTPLIETVPEESPAVGVLALVALVTGAAFLVRRRR